MANPIDPALTLWLRLIFYMCIVLFEYMFFCYACLHVPILNLHVMHVYFGSHHSFRPPTWLPPPPTVPPFPLQVLMSPYLTTNLHSTSPPPPPWQLWPRGACPCSLGLLSSALPGPTPSSRHSSSVRLASKVSASEQRAQPWAGQSGTRFIFIYYVGFLSQPTVRRHQRWFSGLSAINHMRGRSLMLTLPFVSSVFTVRIWRWLNGWWNKFPLLNTLPLCSCHKCHFITL